MTRRAPEGGRKRRTGAAQNLRAPRVGFTNPYPYMSDPEAMVHLELERREVPFSWRFFDGSLEEAPHIKELIPDFAPEFTLREYRIVIMVETAFFANLPGVLDRSALAVALLEADGWTAKILWETDIRQDVDDLLDREFPPLRRPAIKGKPKPNPYGKPESLFTFRTQARHRAFARARPKLEDSVGRNRRRTGRRRHRRGRRDSE